MESHVKCTLNWNHVFEICHYLRSRQNLKCNKIILLSRGNLANASQCMSLKTASYAIRSRTFVAIYLAYLLASRSLFTWWLRRFPAVNLRWPRWCPIVDHWPNYRFVNYFLVGCSQTALSRLTISCTISMKVRFLWELKISGRLLVNHCHSEIK